MHNPDRNLLKSDLPEEEHLSQNSSSTHSSSRKNHSPIVNSKFHDRRYSRNSLSLKIVLDSNEGTIRTTTQDISPGGLSLLSTFPILPGTPLDLKFSFGRVCYLNLSGRIVFCRNTKYTRPYSHHIGIAFSRIRDWEQIILLSSFKEVEKSVLTREKSVITISVFRDKLATAASRLPNALDPLNTSPVQELEDSLELGNTPANSLDLFPSLIESPISLNRFLLENFKLPELPTYGLLVGGKEIDTHVYKYCFLADKILEEPLSVVKISKQLRAGIIPKNIMNFVFARHCIGTKSLNLLALESAESASKEFRFFSLSKRLQIARDIHHLLVEKRATLIDLMVKEGHPYKLAEWEYSGMEQAYRNSSLNFFKKELMKKFSSHNGEIHYLIRRPDGVVGVCPPRNAPCSSSLIAGFSLLAGNTLIVKPPLQNPTSTLYLWKEIVQKSLEKNGAPPGTLNLILGNSSGILDDWIKSPYLNDILFIGETKIGLGIGKRVFQSGKKPILELSGNDMMFIWKDANLVESVHSLSDGFLGSTQICMAPKKAFIHSDIYQDFETLFLEVVKNLRLGLPSDPSVHLCAVSKIAEFYEFLNDALNQGAELLCGGKRVNHLGKEEKEGKFITPAVVGIPNIEQALTMKCIKQENFFPLIPLVRVGSHRIKSKSSTQDTEIFHKMVSTANTNEFGLRISAWVQSPKYLKRFKDNFHNSGLLRINCRHIGFSPFLATHGGTKKSGGPFGELNYVWQKTSHLQGVTVKNLLRDE